MRGWDINAGRRREVPEERWTAEWHTEPKRPSGISDEDWQNQIECNGHDMAVRHMREFATKDEAVAFAKTVLNKDWYGSVIVQCECPNFMEGSAFFWESAGETIYVDEP